MSRRPAGGVSCLRESGAVEEGRPSKVGEAGEARMEGPRRRLSDLDGAFIESFDSLPSSFCQSSDAQNSLPSEAALFSVLPLTVGMVMSSKVEQYASDRIGQHYCSKHSSSAGSDKSRGEGEQEEKEQLELAHRPDTCTVELEMWASQSDQDGIACSDDCDSSDVSSLSVSTVEPARGAGSVYWVVPHLQRYDAWWNKHHELCCALLPLVCFMSSVAIFISWNPRDLASSLVYKTANLDRVVGGFPLNAWLLAICSIMLSSGGHHLMSMIRESLPWTGPRSLLKSQDKRLEIIARFYVVTPLPALSIGLLIAASDPDDHKSRTKLAILAVWFVWAMVFFVVHSVLCIFCHPSEPVMRPSVFAPIMIINSIIGLLAQASTCGFISDSTITLNTISAWGAFFMYLAGSVICLGLLEQLWRRVTKGEPLKRRFWEVLFLASILQIWLQLYLFVGMNYTERLITAGVKFDFRDWVLLRLAPGCIYMTFWSVRCNEVIVCQAETEAKLRLEAIETYEEHVADLEASLNLEREEKYKAKLALRVSTAIKLRKPRRKKSSALKPQGPVATILERLVEHDLASHSHSHAGAPASVSSSYSSRAHEQQHPQEGATHLSTAASPRKSAFALNPKLLLEQLQIERARRASLKG